MQNKTIADEIQILGLDVSRVWDTESAFLHLRSIGNCATKKTAERRLHELGIHPVELSIDLLSDEYGRGANSLVLQWAIEKARSQRKYVLFLQLSKMLSGKACLHANDARGKRFWCPFNGQTFNDESIKNAIVRLQAFVNKDLVIFPHGELVGHLREMQFPSVISQYVSAYHPVLKIAEKYQSKISTTPNLARLEAESIHIIREACIDAKNPVMLYSVGKDSSVMLHLARKAFYPGKPPFALLHVDTGWKFQEMYLFRDYIAKISGMDLLVYMNPEALSRNINPFDHGSSLHTEITKTEGLKKAIEKYGIDIAFGGARRDEEKSRAKERIFSFRSSEHRWDPKRQRPELWNLYNTKKKQGESIRVFPLSNWTELDIWQYIYCQNIPVVPLYFAKKRPVVVRDGMILMVDDSRFRLLPGEKILEKDIRFRTLGCYPLTGAIESKATNVKEIILEIIDSKTSERQGRAIDSDVSASMEKKKQEGYF